MRAPGRYLIIAVLGATAACSDSGGGNNADDDAGGGKNGGASGTDGSAGNAGKSSSGGATGAAGKSGTGGSAGSAGAAGTSGAGGTTGSGGMAGMAGKSGSGGMSGAGGKSGTGGMPGTGGTSGSGAMPSFDEVKGWIEDYASAHPGADGDINGKTPAQIAADPDAQRLLSLCGEDQRPVIPMLAWEFGGGDHAWINYEVSALVYCVYTPVAPDSDNWQYDATEDHVTADVYILFPDQNPCKDEQGTDQVVQCIGDSTNFEILVDIASLNDGADAGLELSEASTQLNLILPDDTKTHLWDDA